MKKILTLLPILLITHISEANDDVPQFVDYSVDTEYMGANHPLVMDDFGREFEARLSAAIKHARPTFAGHYIVTGWGCGAGGCNTGAIIDAITGQAYPFPVALTSVFPLKPEFDGEDGQELIYRLDSRLMIFAGDLYGSNGDAGDEIQFYEFKGGNFVLVQTLPYGKKDNSGY